MRYEWIGDQYCRMLQLQWMTAGRGILHSEMPATDGVQRGLQLWVNLPAKDKMCVHA